MLLYDWNAKLDFGRYKGLTIEEIKEHYSLSYVCWCFRTISWFCVTDEIFSQLDQVLMARVTEDEEYLESLIKKHEDKKGKLNSLDNRVPKSYTQEELIESENWNYIPNNPAQDPEENPWIGILGPCSEAEFAYWNPVSEITSNND
ncbi:MAG: hypothetical protein ABR595_07425 [Psychroflexus sp.]